MEFDGRDQKNKAERGKKGIRGSTAEGLLRKKKCNHHFFGKYGRLPGREIIINFVGKQQGRGKT